MKSFDDVTALADAVGCELGVSDWHTVTQAEIDGFAEATGDRQWIHVDAERAKEGPFGSTVAHGYLTMSLIPHLEEQIYEVGNIEMGINYGSDKVRFLEPVPVGSRVRMHAALINAVSSPAGLRTTTRATLEIEGKAKPACVAEVLTLWVPR